MAALLDGLTRRGFLGRAAAAAVVVAAHDTLAAATLRRPLAPARGEEASPFIREIRLLTAAPLDQMRRFYHDLLGFAVLEETAERIMLAAGRTRLAFTVAGREDGEPFYHFAFNIPQNKLLAARRWQLERSELVPTPEQLRDPAYPDDVRWFRSWHAHSLFFFDPAFNIVEYIARHDLKNDAEGEFTTADILYASEIGYMVEDPAKAARMLHERLRLDPYPRGTQDWWAMGDERGLLLCLPKGRVFGENTSTPKTFSVFPTRALVSSDRGPVQFEDYPYRVEVG